MSGPHTTASSDGRVAEANRTVSRRTVLGTVGVAVGAGVAGCTATADRQPTPTSVVDATARVEPGHHETFAFELDEPQWTTVSASLSDRSVDQKTDGPAVDVVVMTAEQYSRFQSERTFEYVGGVSMPDVVNGQVSDTLDPGAYVALVDNSPAGPAEPGGSTVTGVVHLEITASDSRR